MNVIKFVKFDIYHKTKTQREKEVMYCTVCTWPGAIRLCRSNFVLRTGHIFLIVWEILTPIWPQYRCTETRECRKTQLFCNKRRLNEQKNGVLGTWPKFSSPHNPEVVGSSPASATIMNWSRSWKQLIWTVQQRLQFLFVKPLHCIGFYHFIPQNEIWTGNLKQSKSWIETGKLDILRTVYSDKLDM